ncbi:hypothetical protein K2173_016266 [Erythroxylum novogranatense]|uniref:CCT domain-containing protein n=1 Tax=Erythroxylum novogranatense TaxID=1862640 RepID=A0AAV8SGC8_9ROSI|nr:hypothetical protein K2173_016266 [Erythroxylum novogranatense]
MSSSCLSGGGRTYRLDLDIVKSPSTSTWTSQTSSPSSTLSESSNSPLAISTRKPRTPRKRPNQTYNEAAALLSTAYPNIFSTKHLTNHRNFTKPQDAFLLDESSELLLPFRVFDNSGFPIHQPIRQKPSFSNEPKIATLSSFYDKPCQTSTGEFDSQGNSMEMCDGYEESLDAESILDEEIEEGIDSIMGNLSVFTEAIDIGGQMNSFPYAMGLSIDRRFQLGLGPGGVRAFRNTEDANWWNFPIVDMLQISPRLNNKDLKSDLNLESELKSKMKPKPKPKPKSNSNEKKKKKFEKPAVELKNSESGNVNITQQCPNSGLLLKLDYDDVLNAWSDRGFPFSDDGDGIDASARLAQIDLFSETGVREASVLRYKEKRRTRLFSKKIRYQVRKVNADQRPRMKGRFVRRPASKIQEEKAHKKRGL